MSGNTTQNYPKQTQKQIMESLQGKSPRQAARMYSNYLKNPGTHPDTIKNFAAIKEKNPGIFDFSPAPKGNSGGYRQGGYTQRSKYWKSDITGFKMDRTGWGKEEYAAERKLSQIPSGRRATYLQAIARDPNAPVERKRAYAKVSAAMKKQNIYVSDARAKYNRDQTARYRNEQIVKNRDRSGPEWRYLKRD